jgi:hypothetical protein
MMKTTGVLVSALVALWAWPAAAQVAPLPTRDRPAAPTTGTAVVKGRVVDGQTGLPIARARVRLMGIQTAAAPSPSMQTDESGAFAFSKLPAGSYSLQADKPTYQTGRYPDSGQTLRTSFRPLVVGDGQTVDNISVSLLHGAAISGRVLDIHGDPLENVEVRAMMVPKSGRGRPQMRSGGSSNDIGEFRVARLPPGRYILMVVPHGFFSNPNDVLSADPQPIPTYYPAALSMEEAQPITLERGSSVTGLDLIALEGVGAVVSGTVVDATGQPAPGNGSVMARGASEGFAGSIANGPIKPDGTFQIKLPAGDYSLEARMAARQMDPGTPPQVGVTRVSVSGSVSDVQIVLGGGASVSGRVVFEGNAADATPAVADTRPTMMRMAFSSFDGSLCQTGRTTLAADWTFKVEGIVGTCRAQFVGNLGRWTVKAILHGGVDLMDRPVTFNSEQWRNVQVVLTDKRTELDVQVTDPNGNATREYVALVFSVDKTRWDPNFSRYMRSFVPSVLSARVNPVGAGTAAGSSSAALTFTPAAANASKDSVNGLPAGDYYVVALDDIDADGWRDPDVLEQLSRAASRITISEAAPAEIRLRQLKLATIVGGR